MLIREQQVHADEPTFPAGGIPRIRNASGRRRRGFAARHAANATGLRARALAARFAAECCGACGRALAAGEAIWLSRFNLGRGYCQAPTCGDCRRGRGWLRSEPCAGCGRPVSCRASRRLRRHAFCSDRCRRRWYHRGREASSALARRRRCIVCGRGSEAGRRDALACSSACRHRPYRARITRPTPPRSAAATGDVHGRDGPAAPSSNASESPRGPAGS